jgi:hypothetical protein
MRSAGVVLFTGLCAALASVLLVCGFLAFFFGGLLVAGSMVGLACLVAFVGWSCDYTRDRTGGSAADR